MLDSSMIKEILLLVLFLSPYSSFGQMGTTTKLLQNQDSITTAAASETDSLLVGVRHRLDSLQGQLANLNIRLDSLQNLGQGTHPLNDSLQLLLLKVQAQEQTLLEQQQLLSTQFTKYKATQEQLTQLGMKLPATDAQHGFLRPDGFVKK